MHVFLIVYSYIFKSCINLFFKIGVYDNCEPTDTWSWTAEGSLKYKNKWCIKPKTGWENPENNVNIVLDSTCDHAQNFFKFIPSKYCSVFYTTVKFVINKYSNMILSTLVLLFSKGAM